MHVEFLLEEPSAEAALIQLIPKLLPAEAVCGFHPFQGKRDLLAKLPARLRGYSTWQQRDLRIVILLDRDNDDCHILKRRVKRIVEESQFISSHTRLDLESPRILTRIAIEELEAWFLGDMTAIQAAYPHVPCNLDKWRGLRNPDEIKGGTWEYLERILMKYGDHRGGLEKTRAAREIAAFMEPSRNRSKSFQVFREGLLRLVEK